MALRAAVLTLALLISACGEKADSGLTGESGGQPDQITLELDANTPEPIGLLSYGSVEQEGQLGTHCWLEQCVDFVTPPTPLDFTEIPTDVEIEFTGDGYPGSLSVGRQADAPIAPLEDEREIDIEDGHAELELEPGRYVLVVFATWSEGDAQFAFGVEAT